MKPPLLSFRALLQTDKKTFVERMPPTAHHETQLYKRAHTLFRNHQSLWFIAWFYMVLHPLFLFLMDPSSSWQVLVWGLIFKLNCAQCSVAIFCPKISLAWSEVLRQTKSILEQRESLITTDCRWNKASINYMSKPKCITRPNSFKITKGESIANEMNKMIK